MRNSVAKDKGGDIHLLFFFTLRQEGFQLNTCLSAACLFSCVVSDFPSQADGFPKGQHRLSLPSKKAEQTLRRITAYKYLTSKRLRPNAANNSSVSLEQWEKLVEINKEGSFLCKISRSGCRRWCFRKWCFAPSSVNSWGEDTTSRRSHSFPSRDDYEGPKIEFT